MYKEQQFLALLKPISSGVKAYARHLAWNPNDCEDIFQTAIMNAMKKFDSFTEGTNFKAWFLKFVTFAAYNINRKHQKITSHEVVLEAEYISNSMTTDEEVGTFDHNFDYEQFIKNPDMILENIKGEIKDAIRSLPDRRRSIFLLRSIVELSYQEIANVLEIPVGTVMGELFRARKHLRKELKGQAKKLGYMNKDGE